MLILIEGADGSGKSTLCKNLKNEKYNVTFIPRDTKNIYKAYKKCLKQSKHKIVFIDRSYITDIVYRLARRDCKPSFTNKQIESLLHNTKIVYCKSDEAYNCAIKRGENNITNKLLHNKICKIYDYIMYYIKVFANVEVMNYDWHRMSVDNVIKFIEGGDNNDTVSV